METLALQEGYRTARGETARQSELLNTEVELQSVESFGKLLRYARLLYGKSQMRVCAEVGYTTRNLISVENGKQEPSVMTALKLVCATGCDVAWFFNTLIECCVCRSDERTN